MKAYSTKKENLMNRNSYRMLALVLVFAMMLGVTMSMMPAAAQAHGMGGPPMYHKAKSMHTGSAYFKPTHSIATWAIAASGGDMNCAAAATCAPTARADMGIRRSTIP